MGKERCHRYMKHLGYKAYEDKNTLDWKHRNQQMLV